MARAGEGDGVGLGLLVGTLLAAALIWWWARKDRDRQP
jgi:hypothetical protein